MLCQDYTCGRPLDPLEGTIVVSLMLGSLMETQHYFCVDFLPVCFYADKVKRPMLMIQKRKLLHT